MKFYRNKFYGKFYLTFFQKFIFVMIVEISNQKETYLSNLGLLNHKKQSTKNSIRLISNNDSFKFNVNGLSEETTNRHKKQMNRLSKQTIKANRISTGKNRQEEKRLKLETSILDKNYCYEDSQWLRDFINTKKILQEINISSRSSRDSVSVSLSPLSTRFNSSRSPKRQQSLNVSEVYCSSVVDDAQFRPRIKSYTSLLGPDSDLNERELQNFSLKLGSIDQSSCLSSRAQTARETSRFFLEPIESNKKECEEITGFNDVNDSSIEIKSIRRPLRRTGSANDVLCKLKSLQSKVDFCKGQNEIDFVKYDRNVRYGDPLPRSKLYRQLRILAKVEEIIR